MKRVVAERTIARQRTAREPQADPRRTPHEFTWTIDLSESAGWNAGDKVKLSQWANQDGLKPLDEINGGKLTRGAQIEGRGILALKLEVGR